MAKKKLKKTAGELPVNIVFAIRKVKEIFYSVNETLYVNDPNKEVSVNFQQSFKFDPTRDTLNLTLRVMYFYKGESPSKVLAEIQVDNIFYVEKIASFAQDEIRLGFPHEFWAILFGMAVSHARALFSKNLASTAYRDTIIPVIKPKDLVEELFKLETKK